MLLVVVDGRDDGGGDDDDDDVQNDSLHRLFDPEKYPYGTVDGLRNVHRSYGGGSEPEAAAVAAASLATSSAMVPGVV